MVLEACAQATLEYALVTVALLSMVAALGALWRAGESGAFARAVEQSASHALSVYGMLDISLY